MCQCRVEWGRKTKEVEGSEGRVQGRAGYIYVCRLRGKKSWQFELSLDRLQLVHTRTFFTLGI